LQKIGYPFLILLGLAVAGMCVAAAGSGHFRSYLMTLRAGIRGKLMTELSIETVIPPGPDAASGESATMIYVLGSAQERLTFHFRTAADLYKQGIGNRIFILSRPGITEYSPKLSRNLTNDEWSVRELAALGVPAGDVEAVPVPSGFFGTFREGGRISRLARERGNKRLVLVCSPHHAKRVHLTFSHFAKGTMEVYVQGSGDPAGLAALVAEYGKYVWYRRVLIPGASVLFRARKGAPASRRKDPEPSMGDGATDRVRHAALRNRRRGVCNSRLRSWNPVPLRAR
jgi:hypothetical protein